MSAIIDREAEFFVTNQAMLKQAPAPDSFDFVIIGAGSAGCVVADRLSANGKYSVLVLEAGGSDRRLWIRLPVGYAYCFNNPEVNWRYSAAPDPQLNGRSMYWPRGKVLGGSSSINALVYCRGLPNDFEDWEKAGAAGWNWDAVEATYEQLERHVKDGRTVRGNGPVWVTDPRSDIHGVNERFFAAAREAGWPVTDDANGPRREGFGHYHIATRNGRRWSSADAFLRPALRRGNVRLETLATVDALFFEGNRVAGVAYRRNGRSCRVRADREVIVSAGAVNSPKLLQLSGLGPAALLREHGIEVVSDMPEVGGGLQDHLAVTYYYKATEPTLNNQFSSLPGKALLALRYALTRRGAMSLSVNQCGGFMRSGPGIIYPDMQLYCSPLGYSTGEGGTRPVVDSEAGFHISFQPGRPTSRGRIDIASRDPDSAPVIVPNSLSTHEDEEMVIRGARLVRMLASTPSMRKLVRAVSGPDILKLDDVEALADFRARASTVFHASCTCRMGRDASNSVTDARLRVHNIAGLRVVDASAFPNITTGNTNAPTLMLAERAGGMILEDHEGC